MGAGSVVHRGSADVVPFVAVFAGVESLAPRRRNRGRDRRRGLRPGFRLALAQGRAAGARERRGGVQREHGTPEPVQHDPQFCRPARASRASVGARGGRARGGLRRRGRPRGVRLATQTVAGQGRRRRARARRGRPLRGCPRACRRSRGHPRGIPRGAISLGAFPSRAFGGPRDLVPELSLELRLEVAQRLPIAGAHRVPRARPRHPEGSLHRVERNGRHRERTITIIRPLLPNAQRAARRGFAFYLPPALKISPSPRGLGRVATSEARRLVSRHARPFPSAGEAPAFRAFEPRSRRRNPTPRPHVPGFRSNGFARVRKRCPSARRPRSRRGTPTRSTTASMTTTEGCVRFERAAPREAGGRPERRADSSRETINDPSATQIIIHRPSSDGKKAQKSH